MDESGTRQLAAQKKEPAPCPLAGLQGMATAGQSGLGVDSRSRSAFFSKRPAEHHWPEYSHSPGSALFSAGPCRSGQSAAKMVGATTVAAVDLWFFRYADLWPCALVVYRTGRGLVRLQATQPAAGRPAAQQR